MLDHPKVWSMDGVLQILNDLVTQSKIREELGKDFGQSLYETEGLDNPAKSNVLRTLGYFSLTVRGRSNAPPDPPAPWPTPHPSPCRACCACTPLSGTTTRPCGAWTRSAS